MHNIVDVLNATELYTLKWFILCYVNFSIKKYKNFFFLNITFFTFNKSHRTLAYTCIFYTFNCSSGSPFS